MLSGPCGKILRHVKEPYEYERDTSSAKFTDISRQLSPFFATRCLLVFARELWLMSQECLKSDEDAQYISKCLQFAWDAFYDTAL
jgi:hypothetical protein